MIFVYKIIAHYIEKLPIIYIYVHGSFLLSINVALRVKEHKSGPKANLKIEAPKEGDARCL